MTLKLGWTETPFSLNPFIGSGTSHEIWRLNYDTLVGFGADGLPSPETGLALELARAPPTRRPGSSACAPGSFGRTAGG